MRIYVSHGADPDDWFIVEPREGKTSTSIIGTEITPDMAVESLLSAGRTVYEIDAVPYAGRQARECGRHGGAWGSDLTCADCTDENGDPRP